MPFDEKEDFMKNFLALILALIMIFSVSVAAFATDNYSEYFSVER